MMRKPLPPLASNDLLCGADFDEFNAGRGSRNRKTVFAKAFDMEFNSFLDKFQDFVASFPNCHTTRQVGNMCAKTGFALLDNDGVFHSVILFQPGLFENAVQCARRHVDVWFAGDRHGSTFRWMFELAVTALCPRQVPPILFELPDEVTNLHVRIIGARSEKWKPHNLIVDTINGAKQLPHLWGLIL
jgi:hypothetical protein